MYMINPQESLKDLQRSLSGTWNPNSNCEIHPEAKRCEYGGRNSASPIKLHLCGLGLSQIPDEFGWWDFVDLQELHLQSNRLSILEEDVERLSKLLWLNLCDNRFSGLPDELEYLDSLLALDLSNNQFSTLPAVIGSLSSLQALDLSNNQLSTLPTELRNLSSLQALDLSNNQFSTLPAVIGSLSSLQMLALSNNQLSALPTELGSLPSLKELHLDNNPLLTLPPGLIEQGTPGILVYLRTLHLAKMNQHSVTGNLSNKETVRKNAEETKEPPPIKIFYCYAHEDKDLRDRLDKHLGVLKRLGQVVGWYDREIQAGTEWKSEIEGNLNTANIILLLVSADFVSSDYCYSIEMKKALELHRTGQARVLPILLRPVDWQDAPFATLQMLPTGARPVTKWSDPEEALEDIARGIRNIVNSFHPQKR